RGPHWRERRAPGLRCSGRLCGHPVAAELRPPLRRFLVRRLSSHGLLARRFGAGGQPVGALAQLRGRRVRRGLDLRGVPMKTITFHLDFVSPYAWLAFDALPRALQGLEVEVVRRT